MFYRFLVKVEVLEQLRGFKVGYGSNREIVCPNIGEVILVVVDEDIG